MELIIAAAAILLLYFLQVMTYRLFWNKNISASFSFQKTPAREGEAVCIYEHFVNAKKLPLPVFNVMFDVSNNGKRFHGEDPEKKGSAQRTWFLNEVLSLRGEEEKKRTIEVQGFLRGRYEIPEIRMITGNLFLTDWFSLEGNCDSHFYVYPRELSAEELQPVIQMLSDFFLSSRYSYEDDFEIRGIREYQSYDPMKRVNWKASARRNELQVNVMEYVAMQKVMLLLLFEDECGTARREYAIALAAAVAEYCLKQGITVNVLSNGLDCMKERPLYLFDEGNPPGQDELLQGLSRLYFPRNLPDSAELLEQELTYHESRHGGKQTCILLAAMPEGRMEKLSELCKEYGHQVVAYRIEESRKMAGGENAD